MCLTFSLWFILNNCLQSCCLHSDCPLPWKGCVENSTLENGVTASGVLSAARRECLSWVWFQRFLIADAWETREGRSQTQALRLPCKSQNKLFQKRAVNVSQWLEMWQALGSVPSFITTQQSFGGFVLFETGLSILPRLVSSSWPIELPSLHLSSADWDCILASLPGSM